MPHIPRASPNFFLTGGSTPYPRPGPKPKVVMGILKKILP